MIAFMEAAKALADETRVRLLMALEGREVRWLPSAMTWSA